MQVAIGGVEEVWAKGPARGPLRATAILRDEPATDGIVVADVALEDEGGAPCQRIKTEKGRHVRHG